MILKNNIYIYSLLKKDIKNKIKLCSGKAAGNAEDNKINITKVEYDKKHIFNNKVFHRRIKHVRT